MNTKNSLNFVFLAGLLAATIGFLPLMNSNTALAQTNSTGSTELNKYDWWRRYDDEER
ncbi:hypothetical protein [Candidatus Nitrosocosmicus sp. R]